MKIFFSLLLIVNTGCFTSDSYSIRLESPDSVIITGEFGRSVLQTDDACKIWYDRNYSDYRVDTALTAMIGDMQQNVNYIIIAGTWCGDSKRQLPRLFKIFDAALISDNAVRMFGVDRSKEIDNAEFDRFDVQYVPTVIVLRNSQEIGRIVERPVESLEADLLSILRRQ